MAESLESMVKRIRVEIPGHPTLKSQYAWWACQYPQRLADGRTHWRMWCQNCRYHMALTLYRQGGETEAGIAGETVITFREICDTTSTQYPDPVLISALEGDFEPLFAIIGRPA